MRLLIYNRWQWSATPLIAFHFAAGGDSGRAILREAIIRLRRGGLFGRK
jgi:hypothetical protein